MNDLDRALFEAWNRVGARLLGDGEELRKRLGRRGNRRFARPLRAWCVAVRANDHRINDAHALVEPQHALSLEALAHPGRYAEHRITLDRPLLERVCGGVRITAPGEPADHIAQKLGCHYTSLRSQRRNGVLSTALKQGLMGRRGRAVPLVYNPTYLDPQARGRAGADDIFAGSWMLNAEMVPEGFAQTLTRIPRYRQERRCERFQGWFWVCPRCGETARTLYYPVEQPDLPTMLGFEPAMAAPLPRPRPEFACYHCHGVLCFSRMSLVNDWNVMIMHCTGGLMYGKEVKKPEWLKEERKTARRRPTREYAAPRREMLEQLLVETEMSYAEIAAEVGIRVGNVRTQTYNIFKRHGVGNRAELKVLLAPAQQSRLAAG